LGEVCGCAEESIILQHYKSKMEPENPLPEKLGISPRTLRYKMARMKEAGIVYLVRTWHQLCFIF